jgi:hypothetical protein
MGLKIVGSCPTPRNRQESFPLQLVLISDSFPRMEELRVLTAAEQVANHLRADARRFAPGDRTGGRARHGGGGTADSGAGRVAGAPRCWPEPADRIARGQGGAANAGLCPVRAAAWAADHPVFSLSPRITSYRK